MKKNIIFIGGGGHCKSIIDIAEHLNYNILGILDVEEKIGEHVLSTSIIGSDNDISKYVNDAEFIITVGFITNPMVRIKLFNAVKSAGGKFTTIIAPTAYISKYAEVGEGTVVMHNAVINAEAKIGYNCIINTFANIEHEAVVGNNCHISTGAMVNGMCNLGDNIFVGSQSVIAQTTNIASGSIISAASFVHKNLESGGVYAGNPARKIR